MTSAKTAHQARLLAARMARTQAHPNGNYDHSEHQWGQVHAVHAGPPPTVDLYLNGSQQTGNTAYLTLGVKHLDGYVPQVGDVVLVYRGKGRSRSSRVVLGNLAGSATSYPLPLGSIVAGRYTIGPNALWGGSGVPPTNPAATNGDWYLRSDTANIYQLQSGSWVQIV